jgi:hypothetical protein
MLIDHLDPTPDPGGAGDGSVRSHQDDTQSLGQCDIGGVTSWRFRN